MATLHELQAELQLVSKQVLTCLRSEPDVHAVIAGGQWTVRDTAVQLIGCSRMYSKLLTDQPSPMRAYYDLSVLNAAFFLAMDEDRPSTLADLAERASASSLAGTTGRKSDDPCQYFGLDLNVGFMLALQCSELLLHSFDMARAVGREWACPVSVRSRTDRARPRASNFSF